MPIDAATLFTSLGNWGAFGILVAFLIWKDVRAEATRAKIELDHHAQQLASEQLKLAYDRERLEADKALAAGLAALTAAVQGRSR